MSASIVEYEGFLTSGAATLTPALRFDAPDFSIGGQGSWTVFESGNQIFQATAAAAWLARLRERWRLELSGAAGTARYADEPAAGHVLARSRLHLFGERAGGWLGATTGASFDGSSETPVELSAGAWSVRDGFAVVTTVTATWLGSDRHLDILGAARWTGRRIELEVRAGARPWTDSEGEIGEAVSGVFGELSALVSLGSRVALALSGGSYPADPVRRVLAAKYVTAGLRLALFGPREMPLPVIAGAAIAALREPPRSEGEARLEIALSGQPRTFRLYVSGAAAVELMGDFTDWQTVPLKRVDTNLWEVRVPVSPGVHRLNIRIDGGPWLVPAGARAETGEFGDAVGVVVVR
jgi:hypothetical protein